MVWAKAATVGSPTRKAVLLVLADYADEAGSCFPGQETLARITELGVRTVRRALAELEDAGVIRREERRRPDGLRTSDRYHLVMTTGHSGRVDPPEPVPHRPLTTASPATAAGHEPQVEPQVSGVTSRGQLALVADLPPAAPDRLTARQVDDAFIAWWQEYPRRTGKGAARAAFTKAAQKVPVATLMDAARSFAADPNRVDEFTPHPATWLNQERWADDPLPPRSGPAGPGPSRTAQAFGNFRAIADAARSMQADANALGFGPPPLGAGR